MKNLGGGGGKTWVKPLLGGCFSKTTEVQPVKQGWGGRPTKMTTGEKRRRKKVAKKQEEDPQGTCESGQTRGKLKWGGDNKFVGWGFVQQRDSKKSVEKDGNGKEKRTGN